MVVPTAIKSLMPLSVLDVSRFTQVMSLTYSFVANSKLYEIISKTGHGVKFYSFHPSNVIHMSGDINSSVEQSHAGSEMFEARGNDQFNSNRIVSEDRPSGSHILFPSSSYEVNLACKEEAATINEVEGSNSILEYDRPLGIERVGKGPS